jgi:hypothetical protein
VISPAYLATDARKWEAGSRNAAFVLIPQETESLIQQLQCSSRVCRPFPLHVWKQKSWTSWSLRWPMWRLKSLNGVQGWVEDRRTWRRTIVATKRGGRGQNRNIAVQTWGRQMASITKSAAAAATNIGGIVNATGTSSSATRRRTGNRRYTTESSGTLS